MLNLKKLTTVLSFFRLKSDDLLSFQWHYPTILAGLMCIAYTGALACGIKFDLENIVSQINTLMAALVGFFIASLAAVTSLGNAKLNNVMSGKAPKFPASGGGYIYTTRRRFLTIIIGYCAFLCILIYIMGAITNSVDISVIPYNFMRFILEFTWFSIYLWMLSSLLIVTMLCLHYLIDRAHR